MPHEFRFVSQQSEMDNPLRMHNTWGQCIASDFAFVAGSSADSNRACFGAAAVCTSLTYSTAGAYSPSIRSQSPRRPVSDITKLCSGFAEEICEESGQPMLRQAGEELISAGASSGVCPASGVVWWPNTLSDLGLPATGPSSGPSRYRQIQCLGT